MPSDFISPFLELDEEFRETLRGLEASDDSQHARRVLGFQRRHSLCPVTLPNSKFNSSGPDLSDPIGWGLGPAPEQPHWTLESRLPRSALSRIPFRVDRSVSLIENGGGEDRAPRGVLQPPPGLGLSASSLASLSPLGSPSSADSAPHITTRYKTELCRTYEESGTCKYGAKCQFAHGMDEVRGLNRHPKYKTEPCRTFHTVGFCPYGARCHFIHNADELAPPPPRPKLSHSLSFAGFSSARLFTPVEEESRPPSLLFARASSVSPPPSSSVSPELLSPLFPEPAGLKLGPRPFSGLADLPRDVAAAALRFYAANDSSVASKKARPPQQPALTLGGLQRCSSADSLSEEGYTSSCSLSSSSSGAESPGLEGRRLPIFSRLSVSDE